MRHSTLDDLEPYAVHLTQKLISYPTENPPGNYYECAQFLKKECETLGMEAELVEVESSDRYIVLAWTGTKKTRLHFHCHYDVVPAGAGWTVNPFKGDIVDGKIYGRGSSDMKGGIASVLTAVKGLHDSDISLSLTPDEETGGTLGAAYVVKNRLITTEMAVLPEPTGLKTIYNACKGALWVEVSVPGEAGHPSVKGYGTNAFDKMVKIGWKLLTLKENIENRKSRLKAYPEGGEWATLNAGGRCSSGEAVNTVPGKAVFTIDRRIIPEEDAEGAKQEIIACVDDADVTILLEAEPFYIEEPAPVCQLVKQCVEPVIRDSVTFALCPGFLDARHFVHAGIPCVTWGPGIYTKAHAADEYIRICDVMTAAHVFYNLASIKGI